MRPFEILLALADAAAIVLALCRLRPALTGRLVALPLLIAAIHAVVEGPRWQLAFCYAFALAVCVVGVVRRTAPRWLRGTVLALSALLLAGTVLLAAALPVFELSAPTGEQAVGVRYFFPVDSRRADPFRDDIRGPRQLAVKLFYPAEPGSGDGPAPYLGSPAVIRALAAFYQLPPFALDHLARVRTHSRLNAAISGRAATYPVVLFCHGAGSSMELATAQCEDLASHGYVVAAIDHTYVSAATALPGRVVLAREATHDFDTPEPAEPITRIMADDARFVLDTLRADAPAPLAGRLDLGHVGIIGHSVGGAVAYELAGRDPRIRAAVDLDGVVYVRPAGRIAPFLMLANDRYHVAAIRRGESLMAPPGPSDSKASRATYERSLRNVRRLGEILRESGDLYTIAGSDHMKFTDQGLFIGLRPLREALQIGGATDPARCLEITAALTRAFFDRHLKGAPGAPPAYPELKRIVYPRSDRAGRIAPAG